MNSRLRLQVERATRVAAFSHEHPSTVPGYQAAVRRLDALLVDARDELARETGSRLDRRGAVADRRALETQLVADLRFLAGLARVLKIDSAGTPYRVRFPGPRQNQLQFLASARVAIAKAMGEEGRLRGAGLAEGFLASLSTRLDEYEAFVRQREEAQRQQMSATWGLRTLGQELAAMVTQLDTFNRHRFLGDPAARQVWRTVRRLPGGSQGAAPALDDPAATLVLPPGQPRS